MADSSAVIWPNLPSPMVALNYRSNPGNIRTVMETGRVRNRRQFDDSLETCEVTWNFTYDEFVIFKAFFENDLENGTLPFEIFLLTANDEVEVKFLEPRYQLTRSDNLFQVSAILEMINEESTVVSLSIILEEVIV